MYRLKVPCRARWVLLIAAIALTAGAVPAGAWFSASTSLTYTITTGTWDNDTDNDDPEESDTTSKVWVCKLVDQPGQPRLSQGKNPIRVNASSTSDGRFSDDHGSPVVEEGFDCEELNLDDWPPPRDGPDPGPEGSGPADGDPEQGSSGDHPTEEQAGNGANSDSPEHHDEHPDHEERVDLDDAAPGPDSPAEDDVDPQQPDESDVGHGE